MTLRVADYVDASVFITKMAAAPYVQSKTIEVHSQVFQVSVHTSGRRVVERIVVQLRAGGELAYELGHLFGYNTHRMKPILLKPGEVIEVCVHLVPSLRWWTRLVDAVWDWFQPPKVRVMFVGVARRPTVD